MPAIGSAARGPRDSTSDAAYWDINDIQFHCRIGRSTAWRLVRDDGFPPPIVLGKRSVLWPRNEVLDFIESRRKPYHYRPASPPEGGRAEPTPFVARTIRSRPSR